MQEPVLHEEPQPVLVSSEDEDEDLLPASPKPQTPPIVVSLKYLRLYSLTQAIGFSSCSVSF